MLSETDVRARGLSDLPEVQGDGLMALIALANADQRPDKIDVGVGVFRDGQGRTPIVPVLKEAERILWEQQETKAYIGSAGDKRFAELLRPIVLGRHAGDDRIAGFQTPGGCGALRLGFQLIATANPDARVFVGRPTWPNHPPIIQGVGLQMVEFDYYDKASSTLCFDRMMESLEGGRAGDVVLLHGCCHNPTGADMDREQWAELTALVAERGLLPFVDMAYQGFGAGLEEDAAGLHGLLDACDELVLAQSCDKNFSVYRDRVGSLWVKTPSASSTARAISTSQQQAREMWSMPPDHGAAAVRIVLDTPELRDRWPDELAVMRDRINSVRSRIAAADPRLEFIGRQFGMFSLLPLSRDEVVKLRDQAIYMADSGRFNVVGMSDDQVGRFTAAVVDAMNG